MADSPPADDKKCPQCGFANAATRTFCQDCGARLTGGSGAPVPSGARPSDAVGHTTATPTTQKAKAKRQKEKDDRTSVGRAIPSILRITIYAALIAAIIQIFRAPDDLPSATAMTQEVAQNFRDRLADISKGGGGSMTFPWVLINGYLAERIPPSASSEGLVEVEVIRVVAMPAGEDARLVMERRVSGHLIYLGIDLRPVSRGNGGTTVRVTGGSFGRLPLPGFLASLLKNTFRPVSERLFFELDILREAQSVAIGPEAASATF